MIVRDKTMDMKITVYERESMANIKLALINITEEV